MTDIKKLIAIVSLVIVLIASMTFIGCSNIVHYRIDIQKDTLVDGVLVATENVSSDVVYDNFNDCVLRCSDLVEARKDAGYIVWFNSYAEMYDLRCPIVSIMNEEGTESYSYSVIAFKG